MAGSTLRKISAVREMIERFPPRCAGEVDGGIDSSTGPLAVTAGADVLVAGTSIFADRQGAGAGVGALRSAVTLVNQ